MESRGPTSLPQNEQDRRKRGGQQQVPRNRTIPKASTQPRPPAASTRALPPTKPSASLTVPTRAHPSASFISPALCSPRERALYSPDSPHLASPLPLTLPTGRLQACATTLLCFKLLPPRDVCPQRRDLPRGFRLLCRTRPVPPPRGASPAHPACPPAPARPAHLSRRPPSASYRI